MINASSALKKPNTKRLSAVSVCFHWHFEISLERLLIYEQMQIFEMFTDLKYRT
jgi:hypothetical protein